MDVLPLNFRTLRYCGLWYESYEHLWLIKVIYQTFIVLVLFSFTLLELIELALTYNNVQDLTECLFIALTYLSMCVKIINFMCRQESLNVLLNGFRAEVCQPKTIEEKVITSKYQNMISNIFVFYTSLGLLAGTTLIISPFVSFQNNKIELPIKTYQPFDVEGLTLFSVAYFHQVLSMIFGVLINVSMDLMLCGFVILACGQLELCRHRIISNNMDTCASNHVIHHSFIGDIVKKVQSLFMIAIVSLFIFSLITLCTSLFQMPQKNIISFEFISLLTYLVCMLCQVFFYCWFGNQLQLKSKTIADAIYESNWAELTPIKRKNCLFVMFMSQNGITISFHGQCSLSITTYVWILKTSYGAFNLLQTSSNS